MSIVINPDSINSFAGSVITLTFAIYYFTSYLIIRKDGLFLYLSGFMFTMFMYLIGYSMYSSSLRPESVLFWTRICFSGGVLVALSSCLLSSEIIQRQSLRLNIAVFGSVFLLLMLIFIPSNLLFTNELNPVKTHSSVIKGPFFPYFLYTIYFLNLLLIIRFIFRLLQSSETLRLSAPLLFSLGFWFLESIFDGVFGAILSMAPMKLSLGPIVMTFSLALYSGKIIERKNCELIRVKEENKQIYNSLIYDELSALYSRQYFLEAFEQRCALIKRQTAEDCLMFIDIDNFKKVNDELGHLKGDEVIKLTGEVLRRHSRRSDVCARYGGDEFIILLENCCPDDALDIAENIIRHFKTGVPDKLSRWNGCENVSLSIGIISSPDWIDTPAANIKKADAAMYEAKRAGKNRVVIYRD